MMGCCVIVYVYGESGIDSFLEVGGVLIEYGIYLDCDSICLFCCNGVYFVLMVLVGVMVSEIVEIVDWMILLICVKFCMVGL